MEKEIKRILFVETAHTTEDDRVRYHQMPTLDNAGYLTDVISTLTLNENEKKSAIINKIADYRPNAIICDTPYAVLLSKSALQDKDECKIIYDVTEWYPSKKNLRNAGLLRPIKRLFLQLINLRACKTVDAFIFGEPEKAKPIQARFPKKPAIMLPYYPRTDYITYSENKRDIQKEIRLCYAGPRTREKGWNDVLQAAQKLSELYPQTQVFLTIISHDDLVEDGPKPLNLHVERKPYMTFREFCNTLQDYDVFLDLRENDRENTRCLPIKLFYYMAAGRPMVYSNLKAINDYIGSGNYYLLQSNPTLHEAIARGIGQYIENPDLYQKACLLARKRYLSDYYWEKTESRFTDLMQTIFEHDGPL